MTHLKDLYCKSDGEAINYFLEIIQQQTKAGIHNDKMEIAAWNYVYGLSSDFKKIIKTKNKQNYFMCTEYFNSFF